MSVSEWGGDSGTRVPGADVDASGSAGGDPEQSATASGNDGSGDLSASPAVRALREAPQDVDLCQGCGNPKSEGLHGMSEYGGCV